jgi:hypothetical protein
MEAQPNEPVQPPQAGPISPQFPSRQQSEPASPPPPEPQAKAVRTPEPPPPSKYVAVLDPPPPEPRGAPSWLVMLGAAVGFIALFALLYLYVLPSKKSSAAEKTAEAIPAENAPAVAGSSANKQPHPYAKHLEIVGVRLNEDDKSRVQVQYVVVNHSAADLPELKMQVTVLGVGRPLFDFAAAVPALGPFESKELSTAVKTKLKPYEIPDWQFLKTTFDITSQP